MKWPSQIKELLKREPSRALKTSNQNIDMSIPLAMRSMPFELLVAPLNESALSIGA